jgi:RHS repeat-associated protein
VTHVAVERLGYFFDGDLDEVAIYPAVLSPARVLAHYSAARLAGLATTSYSYDAAGRKASQTDPDGNTTTYGYDADGNQTSLTDAMGRITTWVFDADDRITGITYSDGLTPDVSYAYDAAGRRTSMVDGTGTSSYAYDSAGQLTSVTDGAGDVVGYGYDGLGRIDAITYPDGHQVTRSFDADSRLASVTDWNGHTSSFGYDGDANLVSTTFGNGVVESSTVDDADQITGIDVEDGAGTGLASFGYTYTAGGQVASVTDSLAPTTDNSYGYTANDQLAGQNGDPSAYGYDGAGNITGLDTGDALTYDSAGRLAADQPAVGVTATVYGYDADGDRTSATTGTSTTTDGYDQANRLTSYASNTVTSTYAYDGDGLRASVTGDGAQTDSWDNATSDLPLLLSDGTDDYVYGPGGQVVEQVDRASGTAAYLQHDRIGSVRTLTDQAGTIAGSDSYDSYGVLLAHDGGESTPFGYTGQYTEPSGLIYLRARYYDPATAQFISVDPMLDQTRSWYAYAGADPLDAVDPTGGTPVSVCADIDFGRGGCGRWLANGGYQLGVAASFQVCEANPASCGLGPACPVGTSSYDCAVMLLDPAYFTIVAYTNELAAANSGCSTLTTLKYGLETLLGVAATVTVADGGGGSVLSKLDEITTPKLPISAAEGSLQVIGEGFSDSELYAARTLSAQGRNVVLREATGVGRTSDLLVDGVPYDVYTPTTGSLDNIVSAIASKGSQVNGGGVVLDLSRSPLTSVDRAALRARVRGVTNKVSDIIVIGG